MKAAFFVILIIVMAIFPATVLTGCGRSPIFGENTIRWGSRTLTNNTWGAPREEVFTSGIFLNEDKTFGWYWDRPNPLKMMPDDNYE
jgi:hypothetical protein